MRVLVTGAGGFLGTRVVASLLERGHAVRAMVRPASDVSRHGWGDRVEVFRADLRGG
ncbi:MAG: NAD(P)H-binding protein, partial [Planctomycetota bacterium]